MDRDNSGKNADRPVQPPRGAHRSRYDTNQDGRERPDAAQSGRARPSRVAVKRADQNWIQRHKVFSLLAFVVLLAGAVLAVYFSRAIMDPGAVLINRQTGSPGGQGSAGGQPGYSFPTDVVNILILGTDSNAARVKAGMNARTDCVMLASINTTTKRVSLISIPRDTYVRIYDENNQYVDQNRINAAFAYGGGMKKNGIQYAMNTVRQFLGGGIPIDHYVMFDMDLVKKLIDAVGGVTVDVDITVSVGSVHLKPGKQKLNGAEALVYARDRHNTPGGDFGRVGHQQQVMIALLKELQNKGNIVKNIPQLYSSLSTNVTTDPELGVLQITALAWIAKDVNSGGIKQYTITGNCLTIDGASIVVADQAVKQSTLKEVFGIDYKIRDDETYDHLKGQITEVLNAGKGIINKAQSLLNNNKAYYTADDAKNLKNAIATWQAASKKNDSEGMVDAQQDVQTEYDILKKLVDANKARPEPTPTPEDTSPPTDTAPPEETPAPTDAPQPTETVTPTDTPAPTDSPEITDTPLFTESPQPTDTAAG